MERFDFLCASKQWHCSVCCPPRTTYVRTYVDDIERIDWKLLWNSKIFLFLLFWPSQVKYCFWIKDLGQKFWGIMITGDLFADAQCRDEFMNPSWLGVITLYHGVGRWCPTVTPWDTRGVLCPLGTQDVRNPNSPHAAQPRGHLRHTELCDITTIPEHRAALWCPGATRKTAFCPVASSYWHPRRRRACVERCMRPIVGVSWYWRQALTSPRMGNGGGKISREEEHLRGNQTWRC